MMLSFPSPSIYQDSKCYVTYGVLPHLDPTQPPSKGKPWVTLAALDFIHKVDLLVPGEVFDMVKARLVDVRPAPDSWRVVMSLQDMLSRDFFMEYVKKGEIAMLSEGRIGIDNVFSLRNGKLTMFLDKETYERAGLVGKAHGVKGKRGLKPRWIVELDLTSPAMFPGKKGFDRLVYASKNALSAPVNWLFCNLSTTVPDPDPLASHSPTKLAATPRWVKDLPVTMPRLNPPTEVIAPGDQHLFEDFSTETYEWLSLVRLQSPRVEPADEMDPYLSRYQVPTGLDESQLQRDQQQPQAAKVCKVSWQGFLSPSWARTVLIDTITAMPFNAWFSFSATTFCHSKGIAGNNTECTFLRPPGAPGEYLVWEVKEHE